MGKASWGCKDVTRGGLLIGAKRVQSSCHVRHKAGKYAGYVLGERVANVAAGVCPLCWGREEGSASVCGYTEFAQYIRHCSAMKQMNSLVSPPRVCPESEHSQ